MDIKPTRTFELKFKDPKLKDQTYYSIRYNAYNKAFLSIEK